MTYILIENDAIQGVFDGEELPKGAITVPICFYASKGENVNLFNSDWTRKNKFQLVEENLFEVPLDKKLDANGTLIDLSPVEKVERGLSEMPYGQKIVDGEFMSMSTEELFEHGHIDQATYDAYKDDEIRRELQEIDRQSLRSLRAIITGNGTSEDEKILKSLEKQAETQRKKLKIKKEK